MVFVQELGIDDAKQAVASLQYNIVGYTIQDVKIMRACCEVSVQRVKQAREASSRQSQEWKCLET